MNDDHREASVVAAHASARFGGGAVWTVVAVLDWVQLATDDNDHQVRRIITGVGATLLAVGYLSSAIVQAFGDYQGPASNPLPLRQKRRDTT